MSTYPLFPDETKLASDRQLLAVLENISDAFIIFDTHWCYTYVNRAAETILQKKREDLLGKNVWEVYPEAVGTTVWTKYHEAADTQTVVEFEDFHTPFLKWFHMRVYPSEAGLAVYFQDITERKHAEEQEHFLAKVSKLLASTLDYQETLANIARLAVPQLADWFIVDLVDEHGQIELIEVDHRDPGKAQWARELRKKYPVDPGAPTGAPNVVRTGQAELYAEITDDMLIASARDEEELAITRQIGFTSVMIVPLIARGKTLGAVTFVAAESGRRYNTAYVALAEEVGRRVGVALDNAILYRQVQQSRDQLDVILRGIADGITVQDVNGTVIYANDIAAHLSGFPSAEVMLSMPPATLMQALSRFVMKDEAGLPFTFEQLPGRRALQGEKNVQAIVQYYDTVTGQTLWSLVKAEPLFNEHGGVQFAVNVFVDLTERKELELRKDEFISMASHELKTPVTSLKGFTQVLYRRFKKRGEEEPLSFLARMDGQLNKLTKLINDLLDLSKIQTGKLTVQEEAFDLADVVGDIVDTLQATSQTHQLALEETTHVEVFGDKDRIEQVLINLLTNAIKYSPQADRVIIRVSAEHEQALVSVQDFGIGIAEANQQKIFERFYQVTDPMERTFPGLGIGLFISNEIIKQHYGRMWVVSSKGEGATFYFTLPLYKG
jgi:PAS domain S-box-containing protein